FRRNAVPLAPAPFSVVTTQVWRPAWRTVVVVVELLFVGFASFVGVTVAVFEIMVPSGTLLSTRTTSVKVADAPAARGSRNCALKVVSPPIGRVTNVPAAASAPTNVVPA